MREGWLIDANDHWIWRFHRDNSAWVRDPKVFIDRGRQMPEGPPLLKESVSAEGRRRADVEVTPDPGVEEDETSMGCDCRTLNRCFLWFVSLRYKVRRLVSRNT